MCDSTLDIGIILDASTSVTRENWDETLEFVQKLSRDFEIGPAKVHFGVIRFSWFPTLQFSIADRQFWDRSKFERKVSTIRYTYGGTRTDLALQMAEQKLMCAKCGTRKEAHKALLVLTDGVSSRFSAPMETVTRKLKKDNVKIVSIGIGIAVDYEELVNIATDEDHVLVLNGYQYLDDPINRLVKLLCFRGRKL